MKANYKENKARLEQALQTAKKSGLVTSVQDFASLVDVNRSFLSSLLGGSTPVSDKMLVRVENALAERGVIISHSPESVAVGTAGGDVLGAHAQKNVQSDEVQLLIGEMAEQRKMYAAHVDRLLGLIEKMQDNG